MKSDQVRILDLFLLVLRVLELHFLHQVQGWRLRCLMQYQILAESSVRPGFSWFSDSDAPDLRRHTHLNESSVRSARMKPNRCFELWCFGAS